MLAAGLLASSLAPLTAGSDGDFSTPIVTEPDDDKLTLILQPYGWAPWVTLETAGGTEVDIGLDDIIDGLQFTAMFAVGIQKGRWGVHADIINYQGEWDLGRIDLELDEWIITPKIHYRVWETDRGQLDLVAGARYTWVRMSLEGERGILDESGSADIWDGMIGVQGEYSINERWFIPFFGDIGAGDSDFVSNVYAGVGYRFDWGQLALGFRTMYWDFGSSAPLKDELGYGPVLSAKFIF